ncbi:MAG TPA: hypothetical protein VMG30_05885 [Acidobacteriota bacterium]|nr:hypothetical protein [Acidobacteriota bacterium]
MRDKGKAGLQKISFTRIRALSLIALLGGSLAISCRSRSEQSSQGSSEMQNVQERIAILTRQEQILSAEIAVAKSPTPYLFVDFLTGKIELRAQGKSLRSVSIRKFSRTGGAPFVARTWEETEARPLQIPERAKMVPGSGEETTSSVATQNPWGPKRMPLDYDLLCKENRLVGIRSLASAQSSSFFTRWIISGFRQSRDWARNVFSRRDSAYSESLEIWLAEDDAQLLFWSLPKQFDILIVNGS